METKNYKVKDNVNILNDNGMDGVFATVKKITSKGYKLVNFEKKPIKGFFKDKQLAPS